MNECIFCKIIKGEIPSKKIYEDESVLAFMDINPVTDGHVLIIPKEHFEDFTVLNEDIVMHLYKVANLLTKKLMQKLGSKGVTLTVNYGEAQDVKHFHLHILPDYHLHKETKNVDDIYEIIK